MSTVLIITGGEGKGDEPAEIHDRMLELQKIFKNSLGDMWCLSVNN